MYSISTNTILCDNIFWVFFIVNVHIKQYNVSHCAHNGTIYFKTIDIPLCTMRLF